jgi:flagellar biosynthesis/type III secretory pathway chaperone
MTETLDILVSNREDNKKALQKSETSMIQQISVMKSKLLKHINVLEQKFITKLTSIKEENSTTYNIMFTTKIINLDVCMDLTVYLRRCWYS